MYYNINITYNTIDRSKTKGSSTNPQDIIMKAVRDISSGPVNFR